MNFQLLVIIQFHARMLRIKSRNTNVIPLSIYIFDQGEFSKCVLRASVCNSGPVHS